jgi:hypothetical protein
MTEEKCVDESLQTRGTPPEVCLSARLAAKFPEIFPPKSGEEGMNGQK